jgi:hypothetical protein
MELTFAAQGPTTMSSSLVQLPDSLATSGVYVPRPERVQAYLHEYPDMVHVVGNICMAAHDQFGPDSELLLDVYCDPEIDDRYLSLVVRQASYPANFMSRIEELTAKFADELAQISGWIVVTTDFRPPTHAV